MPKIPRCCCRREHVELGHVGHRYPLGLGLCRHLRGRRRRGRDRGHGRLHGGRRTGRRRRRRWFPVLVIGQHPRRASERYITYVLLPSTIQLLQLVVKHAAFLELVIRLVQSQRRPCVLDRVVRFCLDVLSEDEPGEKTE